MYYGFETEKELQAQQNEKDKIQQYLRAKEVQEGAANDIQYNSVRTRRLTIRMRERTTIYEQKRRKGEEEAKRGKELCGEFKGNVLSHSLVRNTGGAITSKACVALPTKQFPRQVFIGKVLMST